MAKMPAMLDAQKQLEKLSGTYDAENGWRNTLKKIRSSLLPFLTNGDRSKEVQDMQKRIVDFRDNAKKNYNKRIWYCKTMEK
jgi:outer membrane protein